MIKSHKENQVQEVDVIDEVICNCCGKSIKRNRNNLLVDHLHIDKTWDDLSNHDGAEYSLDICEDCFEKIVHNFKIKSEPKYEPVGYEWGEV